MKKFRTVISLLMAMVMTFTLLPFAAIAADLTESIQSVMGESRDDAVYTAVIEAPYEVVVGEEFQVSVIAKDVTTAIDYVVMCLNWDHNAVSLVSSASVNNTEVKNSFVPVSGKTDEWESFTRLLKENDEIVPGVVYVEVGTFGADETVQSVVEDDVLKFNFTFSASAVGEVAFYIPHDTVIAQNVSTFDEYNGNGSYAIVNVVDNSDVPPEEPSVEESSEEPSAEPSAEPSVEPSVEESSEEEIPSEEDVTSEEVSVDPSLEEAVLAVMGEKREDAVFTGFIKAPSHVVVGEDFQVSVVARDVTTAIDLISMYFQWDVDTVSLVSDATANNTEIKNSFVPVAGKTDEWVSFTRLLKENDEVVPGVIYLEVGTMGDDGSVQSVTQDDVFKVVFTFNASVAGQTAFYIPHDTAYAQDMTNFYEYNGNGSYAIVNVVESSDDIPSDAVTTEEEISSEEPSVEEPSVEEPSEEEPSVEEPSVEESSVEESSEEESSEEVSVEFPANEEELQAAMGEEHDDAVYTAVIEAPSRVVVGEDFQVTVIANDIKAAINLFSMYFNWDENAVSLISDATENNTEIKNSFISVAGKTNEWESFVRLHKEDGKLVPGVISLSALTVGEDGSVQSITEDGVFKVVFTFNASKVGQTAFYIPNDTATAMEWTGSDFNNLNGNGSYVIINVVEPPVSLEEKVQHEMGDVNDDAVYTAIIEAPSQVEVGRDFQVTVIANDINAAINLFSMYFNWDANMISLVSDATADNTEIKNSLVSIAGKTDEWESWVRLLKENGEIVPGVICLEALTTGDDGSVQSVTEDGVFKVVFTFRALEVGQTAFYIPNDTATATEWLDDGYNSYKGNGSYAIIDVIERVPTFEEIIESEMGETNDDAVYTAVIEAPSQVAIGEDFQVTVIARDVTTAIDLFSMYFKWDVNAVSLVSSATSNNTEVKKSFVPVAGKTNEWESFTRLLKENGEIVPGVIYIDVGTMGTDGSIQSVTEDDVFKVTFTFNASKLGQTAFYIPHGTAVASELTDFNEYNGNGSYVVINVYEPDYVLGDVDNDGECDTADYLMLKKYYFGTVSEDAITMKYTFVKRSDIDGNGVINANDYFLLKRGIFGYINLDDIKALREQEI